MGLRFYRRLRILPGLTLNLGKRGLSVSAGVRGAHVTLGSGGVRETVGLPGTGLCWTNAITGGRRVRRRRADSQPVAPQHLLSDQEEATVVNVGFLLLLSVCIGVVIALLTLL